MIKDRPERTPDRIVTAPKAKPDRWSFATAQLGAPGHLAELAFNQSTGLDVPIVVYRGRAGRARHRRRHAPIAVTSLKRSTLAPDIPTTAEVGLPQLTFGALCTAGPFHLGEKGRRGEVHD